MRFGIMLSMPGMALTLDERVRVAQQAEAAGFASVWEPNVFAHDALTTLALAGRETSRIELGSAVVPTYPRHPAALAQQALSTQAATRGRLALGIGLSHQVVIEGMFGLDYSRPIPHTREYLAVLTGLLAGEAVRFQGTEYRVAAQLRVPDATPPQVLVAALGPAMLRLCGRLADGTITWMGGLAYLRDFAIPTLNAAAQQAGRPAPRIVCMAPVCAADDVVAAREAANTVFENYGRIPSYRATLDRGGAAGPGDVAVVGDETAIAQQVQEYAAAGVTDFVAAPFATPGTSDQRTRELLSALARGQVAVA